MVVGLAYSVGSQATGDLISVWTFDDGTATDSSGSGNNGVVNGPIFSPIGTQDGNGNDTGSLDFDGVDDYVDLGALDIGRSAVTLAAWVNPDNLANCGNILTP